jgi:hypothetical protein
MPRLSAFYGLVIYMYWGTTSRPCPGWSAASPLGDVNRGVHHMVGSGRGRGAGRPRSTASMTSATKRSVSGAWRWRSRW